MAHHYKIVSRIMNIGDAVQTIVEVSDDDLAKIDPSLHEQYVTDQFDAALTGMNKFIKERFAQHLKDRSILTADEYASKVGIVEMTDS